MSAIIDYETVAREFEETLQTRLRGHGSRIPYLMQWVPDPDIVNSVIAMVDAAQSYGQGEITVRIADRIINSAEVERLLRLARGVGEAACEKKGGAWLFSVKRLNEPGDRKIAAGNSVRTDRPRPSPVADNDVTTGGAPSAHTRLIASLETAAADGDDRATFKLSDFVPVGESEAFLAELEAFGDVNKDKAGTVTVRNLQSTVPFLALPIAVRRKLRDLSRDLAHESALPDSASSVAVATRDGPLEFAVAVDPARHRVLHARHLGAVDLPSRAIYEAFCRVIEGLPIQDAADYGGFKLLQFIRDRRLQRPVRGIMMTVNVDPMLHRPVDLMRRLRASYGDKTGFVKTKNFFEAPPSDRWLALSDEAKKGCLATAIREFLIGRGLGPESVEFRALTNNVLGRPIRVTIAFASDIPKDQWNVRTMEIERWLKDKVEDKIQVFNEEYRDQSKLRRMAEGSLNTFR